MHFLLILIPIIIGILVLLLSGYVKASPDEAIIISGFRKEPKIIIGKAAVKIPFFERRDRLTLKIMKIDVKTQESVPTNEFINVNVDAVVTVKISSRPDLIKLAAENFLNKDEEYNILCQSGNRSLQVAKYLHKQGYQVVNLMGGFGAFRGKIDYEL